MENGNGDFKMPDVTRPPPQVPYFMAETNQRVLMYQGYPNYAGNVGYAGYPGQQGFQGYAMGMAYQQPGPIQHPQALPMPSSAHQGMMGIQGPAMYCLPVMGLPPPGYGSMAAPARLPLQAPVLSLPPPGHSSGPARLPLPPVPVHPVLEDEGMPLRRTLRSSRVVQVTEVEDEDDSTAPSTEAVAPTQKKGTGNQTKHAAAGSSAETTKTGPVTRASMLPANAAAKAGPSGCKTRQKQDQLPENDMGLDELVLDVKRRKLTLQPQKKNQKKSADLKAAETLEQAFGVKKLKTVPKQIGNKRKCAKKEESVEEDEEEVGPDPKTLKKKANLQATNALEQMFSAKNIKCASKQTTKKRKQGKMVFVDDEDEDEIEDPDSVLESGSNESDDESQPGPSKAVSNAKFSTEEVISISDSDEEELADPTAETSQTEALDEWFDSYYPRMLSPEQQEATPHQTEKKEFDCCVCHEFLYVGDYRGILNDCKHDSFCYPCAYSLYCNENKCPLCRDSISSVESELVG